MLGGGRPAVSVIVPFRGNESQGARLARSIGLLELGSSDEVIVVDNSDGGSFAEDGFGFRVVRATRERSSYYARNAGARVSAGARLRRERPESLTGAAFSGARASLGAAAVRAGESRLTPAIQDSADTREAGGGDSTRESRSAPAQPDPVDTREEAERWLLFIDADCVPRADLLDAYFDAPPGEEVGALAGTVASDPSQAHFLARYASDRGFLDQESGVHTAEDAAATANLAVRRSAFDAVGGFEEGIRSGGDVDLCRRLVAAGWAIERRPRASVAHLHRESLPDLLGAIARYGSGASWLNERYPGSAPAWPVVPGLVGAAKDIATNVAHRRFEEAAFRGVDSLGLVAHAIGYRRSNAAR
jgi:hypothetical protein